MVTRSKKGIIKPKLPFIGAVAVTSVPTSVTESLTNPIWYKATKTEFRALQYNNTWSLVPSSSNMHIVVSKWVFKVKYKPYGQVVRHMAKLVAQGFTQTHRLDFFYTLSSVIKPTTLRIVLSIAATLNWRSSSNWYK